MRNRSETSKLTKQTVSFSANVCGGSSYENFGVNPRLLLPALPHNELDNGFQHIFVYRYGNEIQNTIWFEIIRSEGQIWAFFSKPPNSTANYRKPLACSLHFHEELTPSKALMLCSNIQTLKNELLSFRYITSAKKLVCWHIGGATNKQLYDFSKVKAFELHLFKFHDNPIVNSKVTVFLVTLLFLSSNKFHVLIFDCILMRKKQSNQSFT